MENFDLVRELVLCASEYALEHTEFLPNGVIFGNRYYAMKVVHNDGFDCVSYKRWTNYINLIIKILDNEKATELSYRLNKLIADNWSFCFFKGLFYTIQPSRGKGAAICENSTQWLARRILSVFDIVLGHIDSRYIVTRRSTGIGEEIFFEKVHGDNLQSCGRYAFNYKNLVFYGVGLNKIIEVLSKLVAKRAVEKYDLCNLIIPQWLNSINQTYFDGVKSRVVFDFEAGILEIAPLNNGDDFS